jgi:hypothetical protein
MMKRKSPIIKQGKVTELITELANLPEREKDPEEPVSLSEIFRTKEYAAEVKAALKKGYTFENLAEIFSEKCGVAVSARQIKYHFTRGKNRGMKSKSPKKVEGIGVTGSRVSTADSSRESIDSNGKENRGVTDSPVKGSPKGEGFFSGNGMITDAKPGAFSLSAKPKDP